MDGDAIGGAIDFRTPTAYDFDGETHGSLSIGGNLSDRAIDYGLDSGGGSASFDYSHKLGDHDQLGIYFGGYYDRRSFANSIVDGIYPATANGQYTYAVQTKSGASAPGLDPASNLVLTGVDAGLTTGYEERYGGNLSIDWRPSSTLSGYMRFTYAGDHVEQDTYYSQIYGNSISNTEIGNSGLYQPVIGAINPRFYYETNPEDAILSTYQVGGDAQFGRLHVAPQLFASYGENDEPNHIELSGRYREVAAGLPYGGSSMFTYNNGAPIPILTPQQWAATSDIADYEARRAGELTQDYSHQFRYGGKLDLVYDVDNGWLQNIAAGFKYDDAYRHHTVRDYTTDSLYTTDANAPTFGSLGFLDGSVKAIVPGTFNFSIPLINQRTLFKFFDQKVASEGGLPALSDQCDSLYVNTYNCDTQSGTEATTSIYLMATFKVGQLEIIPGFRFEHLDITNRYWETPQDANGNELPGFFTSDHTTYNKPLPSLQLNYRPSDFTVYRASVWTSYTPPSMFQLGGGEQVSVSDGGPANGGSTSITEGNPNLKTVDALNLDASGEWTNTHGGAGMVAVFYKSLDHYIYDSINGFTNSNSATVSSANGGFTTISKPEDGGAAHLFGLELSGRQKFQDLPAPFDGIGVSGNVTLEHSSVNTESPGLSSNERITNQPDVAANGQLFYEKGPYDFALSYRYTGDYVAAYGTFGDSSSLDTWVHANEQVDLHMGYTTPWGVKLEASIANLLDADTYVASIGRTSNTIPSFVDTGRIYTFRVGYSF
jgi:TonB-dependent receptor